MDIAEQVLRHKKDFDDVYKAGGLAYSPQETVSGAIVAIDDVSPIEHEVDVKVASKNLIDISKWSCRSCTYSDGVFTCNIPAGNQYAEIYTSSVALAEILLQNKGKSITFSIAETLPYKNMAIVIYGKNIEGKNVSMAPTNYNQNNVSAFIREDLASISQVLLRFNWNSTDPSYTDTTTTVSDLQLEIGETATEYTPYVPDLSGVKVKVYGENEADRMQEYIPNADGTVDGVKSIYPNMTITTDTQGLLVDCTYKQDGRKVKQNLTDLIISLGGEL